MILQTDLYYMSVTSRLHVGEDSGKKAVQYWFCECVLPGGGGVTAQAGAARLQENMTQAAWHTETDGKGTQGGPPGGETT